jgi:WD40 repeat protein
VNALALANEDKVLISSSPDNSVKVWDLVENKHVHTIVNAHKERIKNILVTKDGKTAVTSGFGDDSANEIKFWDLEKKEVSEQITDIRAST